MDSSSSLQQANAEQKQAPIANAAGLLPSERPDAAEIVKGAKELPEIAGKTTP